MVLDISARGARIRFNDGSPKDISKFKLRVNRIGQFDVVARWRKADIIGVEFLADPREVRRNFEGRLGATLASRP